MFGAIKDAWVYGRLFLKVRGALKRGRKEGERLMSNPLAKSGTIWGAILAGGAAVFTAWEQFAGGHIELGIPLGVTATLIGTVWSVIRARRATQEAIDTAKAAKVAAERG